MSVDALLSRLDRAKRTGDGRWIARCPAHADKSPSLSIRELDDGRVLIHDFGGCSVEAVLGAVDLTFDALFPQKPIEHGKREWRPFNAHDVLAAVVDEVQIVVIVASDMCRRRDIAAVDYERLLVAHERIQEAGRIAHG